MPGILTDVRSGYSLLGSLFTVPQLVAALKSRGFEAVALTDWQTTAGLEIFERLMRDAGLTPFLGVSLPGPGLAESREIRLIARSPEAWPQVARFSEWDGQPHEGLTVVLGASDIPWWKGHTEWTHHHDVVVELGPHQKAFLDELPLHWHWTPKCRVRYPHPDDGKAFQLLAQIGNVRPDVDGEALPLTPQSWWAPYRDWPEDRLWCPEAPGQSVLPQGLKLPSLPGVKDPNRALVEAAQAGLCRRYGKTPSPDAKERLATELNVIINKGFSGYFLMVQDVVSWCKRQGIRVGPGRGSAAGSLVSYVLGITEVDPIRYGLLFERFLNPERSGLPDIDLDFEDARRGEVIHYLRERFGGRHVAQIGTFGTLGARAVLRDVARVANLPLDRVNRILKSIPWGVNDTLALHRLELQKAARREGLNDAWIELASRLEGLPRHRSTHAAGVVISPEPLDQMISCQGDADRGWVTDFEMASLERLGFVKLDVLGLTTLTVVSHLEKSLGLLSDAMMQVDPQDPPTLKLLARGDTDGVFQLDGRGVKRLLQEMQPRSREDIMVVVALYRPGPMEAISEFLRRRQMDFQVNREDPLESFLQDTYGILVYQEQLMAAVQHVGGFSLSEADWLRRAISKKDHHLLQTLGDRLLNNMRERGYSSLVAQDFWKKIRSFGDYGFNKSHAACYGFLSYYLAYFKANYPLHFWAALLSSHDDADKLQSLLVQAMSQGVRFLPPHVNRSEVSFVVDGDGVQSGLGMLRGIGRTLAEALVQERQAKGPYQSIADLKRRLGGMVGERTLEALASQGALKGLGALERHQQMNLFGEARASEEETWLWPKAAGPIYVRLLPGADREQVVRHILEVSLQESGPWDVLLILEGPRVEKVEGAALAFSVQAIQKLKEIAGVLSAGRQVVRQPH